MKQILLFLLISTSIFAQNPTKFEKVRITSNATSTTATKVNVQEADGTVNTITKSDLIEYLEYASAVNLPVTGLEGKIYLTRDNNTLYRWNGTIYSPITADISGKENVSNKQNSLESDGTNTKYPTVTAVNTLKWIKSNEFLSLAQRKGDVLYGILDQYTGEEITLSKVTGTPTVDNVIYFQLGSEYFKRNFEGVVNVKWFGVSELKSDNTTEINNCITVAESLASGAVFGEITILFPAAKGTYKTMGGHIIGRLINVKMVGMVEDINTAIHKCFVIGVSGAVSENKTHIFNLYRASRSTHKSENDIGIELKNAYFSKITEMLISGFSKNVHYFGDEHGFAYNTIFSGFKTEGWINQDMSATVNGWCNENVFIGGEYRVSSDLVEKIGIRVLNGNGNKFYGASFEKYKSDLSAYTRAIEMHKGVSNVFLDLRHESENEQYSVFVEEKDLEAKGNKYTILYYDSIELLIKNNLRQTESKIEYASKLDSENGELIFDSGNIMESSFTNAGHLILKDFFWQSPDNGNLLNSAITANVTTDYKYIIPSYLGIAATIDLNGSTLMGFSPISKAGVTNKGSLKLKIYNSSGVEITNDLTKISYGTWSTLFGGCYKIDSNIGQASSQKTQVIGFHKDVASVRVIFQSDALDSVQIYNFDNRHKPVITSRQNRLDNINIHQLYSDTDYELKSNDDLILVDITPFTTSKKIILPSISAGLRFSKIVKVKVIGTNANNVLVWNPELGTLLSMSSGQTKEFFVNGTYWNAF